MPQLPKLSYVLLSHNREKYIRAAIESAFAQDYEGELEYIFSDDCSTDRTFEIIKECVAAYKGGRRVVVTQPPTNQHLAGNTNHAVKFVESDWIVRADDDDLSSVDRCTIIGKAIAEHPEATFVFTRMENFTDTDAEEALRKSQCKRDSIPQPRILDAREANTIPLQWFSMKQCLHQVWSTEHFRKFGPLPKDGYWVDDVMAFWRCCVLGVGLDLDVVTSYIRNGSGNMCRGGDDGGKGYQAIIRLEQFNDRYQNMTLAPLRTTCRQMKDYIADHYSPEAREQSTPFIRALEHNLAARELLCTYWRRGTLNRIRVARKLGYHGIFSMLRCLPMPVFAALLALFRKIHKKH
ncbi:MAG: glycosyltransferase family A protein [Akkermansia sp.]|nr:glycosyltransferase family A protein [Akkermansia sp.]